MVWDRKFGGIVTRRPPRVRIQADTDLFDVRVELPFVFGVLADLSGAAKSSLPPVAERRFREVDIDNFDDHLRTVRPGLRIEVPDLLTGQGRRALDLTFEQLDDFAAPAIARAIGVLDERVSLQTDEVLRHPAFQRLEAAWRGLRFLVENVEAPSVVRVLDVARSELGVAIGALDGEPDARSPLHLKLQEELEVLGGTPFGCLIGDYAFDHGAPDLALLRGLASIAAAAHCPFLGGAAVSLFPIDSWPQLAGVTDLGGLFHGPGYAGWRSLRARDESRYLALAMPPFRGLNAAYVMAVSLANSFRIHGWWSRIHGRETGGAVDLSFADSAARPGARATGPLEMALAPGPREVELREVGLLPLTIKPNDDAVAFVQAQSLHDPTADGTQAAPALADAVHAARLPHVMAACAFARHLRQMAAVYKVSELDAHQVETRLQGWLAGYVGLDPATVEAEAARPLAAAEIRLDAAPATAGRRRATLLISPRYQLTPLTAPLCVPMLLTVSGSRGNFGGRPSEPLA